MNLLPGFHLYFLLDLGTVAFSGMVFPPGMVFAPDFLTIAARFLQGVRLQPGSYS